MLIGSRGGGAGAGQGEHPGSAEAASLVGQRPEYRKGRHLPGSAGVAWFFGARTGWR